jgi:hypothetical protein
MTTRFKGYQDVESFLAEEAEQQERDRERVRRFLERERRYRIDWPLLGMWAAVLTLIGLFYGFAAAWIFPLVHRLLAKAGWL